MVPRLRHVQQVAWLEHARQRAARRVELRQRPAHPVDDRNAVRGDGQTPFTIIDGEEQREALDTVLSTLNVNFLKLPRKILELLPPAAYRHNQGEAFPGRSGLLFDALGAAEGSA